MRRIVSPDLLTDDGSISDAYKHITYYTGGFPHLGYIRESIDSQLEKVLIYDPKCPRCKELNNIMSEPMVDSLRERLLKLVTGYVDADWHGKGYPGLAELIVDDILSIIREEDTP